ncbi:MAG TPA: hypothetical protein VGP04_22805 [Pseudonocardiaceae bacterium]|nr:hypothetical protein [Pseudonocardiaceae bacterium]
MDGTVEHDRELVAGYEMGIIDHARQYCGPSFAPLAHAGSLFLSWAAPMLPTSTTVAGIPGIVTSQ